METRFRQILLSSTGIALALGAASPAFAQDVLETVIVTAEKTSTDIQKTSVSITAIAPDDVGAQGQQTLSVMVENVPGITLNRGANLGGAAFVRGVGTTQGTSSTAAAVGSTRIRANRRRKTFATTWTPRASKFCCAAAGHVVRQGRVRGRHRHHHQIQDPTDKYEGKVFVEGGALQPEISGPRPWSTSRWITTASPIRIVALSTQQSGYYGRLPKKAPLDFEAVRGKLQYKPTEDFKIVLKARLHEPR